MNEKIYSLYPPEKYKLKGDCFGHLFYKTNKTTVFVPKKFLNEYVNPINFMHLKQKFFLKSVLVLDKTSPVVTNVCFVDHINRSGFNFLMGKTPIYDCPMFPDMSNIYKPIKSLKKITVHTVGPKRFKKEETQKEVVSESIGLIAPIWHYVGVGVSGRPIGDVFSL